MELNYLPFQSAHGTRTLSHHGVKGMKWGVRRYQRKDGSLTPAGKKKYAKDNYHEDYKRAHDKKSVKYMSDQELRERNNRLNAEQQYNNMTRKTGIGKKAIKAYIATAGTIAGLAAATATYKKYADKGLDSIGNWVVKGIRFGKLTD